MARRNVDGQELLYHSIRYTNQITVLSELKMQQATGGLTVCLNIWLVECFKITAIAQVSSFGRNCKFERSIPVNYLKCLSVISLYSRLFVR